MRASRLPLPALAVLVLVLAVLASGCRHGGADGRAAVTETAGRLPEIRSGDLELGVIAVFANGADAGGELRGPFSLEEGQTLPRFRLELTGPSLSGAITLVSDGEEAWAEAFGSRVPLNEDQQTQVRRAVEALTADGGFRRLALEEWVVEPRLTDGDVIGGAETDRVTGGLDVVAALNDLLGVFAVFGRELEPLEGERAEQLRLAVRSSSFELHTGKEDRLLRRLAVEAELADDLPGELGNEFGGATVTFRLGVARPNEPVEIETGEPPSG